MEEKILQLFKLPLKYDAHGQMIFDSNNRMVADVRAWGYLQYKPNPEELQDTLGEMIAKAFNEKYGK